MTHLRPQPVRRELGQCSDHWLEGWDAVGGALAGSFLGRLDGAGPVLHVALAQKQDHELGLAGGAGLGEDLLQLRADCRQLDVERFGPCSGVMGCRRVKRAAPSPWSGRTRRAVGSHPARRRCPQLATPRNVVPTARRRSASPRAARLLGPSCQGARPGSDGAPIGPAGRRGERPAEAPPGRL